MLSCRPSGPVEGLVSSERGSKAWNPHAVFVHLPTRSVVSRGPPTTRRPVLLVIRFTRRAIRGRFAYCLRSLLTYHNIWLPSAAAATRGAPPRPPLLFFSPRAHHIPYLALHCLPTRSSRRACGEPSISLRGWAASSKTKARGRVFVVDRHLIASSDSLCNPTSNTHALFYRHHHHHHHLSAACLPFPGSPLFFVYLKLDCPKKLFKDLARTLPTLRLSLSSSTSSSGSVSSTLSRRLPGPSWVPPGHLHRLSASAFQIFTGASSLGAALGHLHGASSLSIAHCDQIRPQRSAAIGRRSFVGAPPVVHDTTPRTRCLQLQLAEHEPSISSSSSWPNPRILRS